MLLNGVNKVERKEVFLACDMENHRGINLYESLGYVRAEGRGEIRMEKLL